MHRQLGAPNHVCHVVVDRQAPRVGPGLHLSLDVMTTAMREHLGLLKPARGSCPFA